MRRSVLSIGIVASAVVIPTTVSASSHPTAAVKPASVQSCGVRVYMTASGSQASDATNDAGVKTSLETNTDLCITIGVQYFDLQTVSANITTTNYDVIYIQGQNNWRPSDLAQFGDSDAQVIEDFLTAGGGIVVGEWHAWNECVSRSSQAWIDFARLMPVIIRDGCRYGSSQKVRFYRWERPLSGLVDTGVGADFVFEPADFAGSLSFLNLKQGATPYYWATWNSVVANIPVASDPTDAGFSGGVGMAGWVPTGYTGRVFSFSTTNGAPELADTSAANSFRRLLINSLGWAGSVGGSINPDSVAVDAAAGSSISTPPFVPSRMTGPITYSIISGTLPSGLTLNTTNGQITGTPTHGGDIDVTIQATTSTEQATARVLLKIAGGSAPVNNSQTDTSTTNSEQQVVSTTTTTIPKISSARTLPSTGSSSTVQTVIAVLLLAGGIHVVRRLRYSS